MDWDLLLRNSLPTLMKESVSTPVLRLCVCVYIYIHLNKLIPLQYTQNLALKAMITCPGGSIRMLCGDPNAKKASYILLFHYNLDLGKHISPSYSLISRNQGFK